MRSDLQSTLGLCQEDDTVCILRTRSLPLIERIFVKSPKAYAASATQEPQLLGWILH